MQTLWMQKVDRDLEKKKKQVGCEEKQHSDQPLSSELLELSSVNRVNGHA